MQTIYKIINKIELKNIRYNINENFLIDKYWETNDSRYLSISDEMQYIINDLLKKDVIEIYTND
jgi:Mg2+/Co2+ transporter CorC